MLRPRKEKRHTRTHASKRPNQILFHFDFATMCRGQGHSSYVIIYGLYIHWFVQLSISFESFFKTFQSEVWNFCVRFFSLYSSVFFAIWMLLYVLFRMYQSKLAIHLRRNNGYKRCSMEPFSIYKLFWFKISFASQQKEWIRSIIFKHIPGMV